MKSPRISIGAIRRRQIVDAAWAVIAEKGLQELSLSEIEKRVGMSRGQLTYYFKAKEDILLAVFDRLLDQCQQRDRPGEGDNPLARAGWEEAVAWILRKVTTDQRPEFHALHCTFLAQISHRADFRRRLAQLYEEWRGQMITHLTQRLRTRPAARTFTLRAFVTVVQAMIHGLAIQAAVDPRAVPRDEAVDICLQMLHGFLWPQAERDRAKGGGAATQKPGHKSRTPARPSARRPASVHRSNGKTRTTGEAPRGRKSIRPAETAAGTRGDA